MQNKKRNFYLYLDFDGVLNNGNEGFGDPDYFNFNKCNVDVFLNMVERLQAIETLGKVNIVLNTAWKMTGDTKLMNKVRLESPIQELAKGRNPVILGCTKTFNFYSSYGDYSCKTYEVEHYIIENNLRFDDNIHMILDDEEMNQRLKHLLCYKTCPDIGLTQGDADIIVKIADAASKTVYKDSWED